VPCRALDNFIGTNGGLAWPGEGLGLSSGGRLAGRGLGCGLQGVALQLALLALGACGGWTSGLFHSARYLGHLAAGVGLGFQNLRKHSVHSAACSPCGRLPVWPAPARVLRPHGRLDCPGLGGFARVGALWVVSLP